MNVSDFLAKDAGPHLSFIICSLFFWVFVAFSFPMVAIAAKYIGITNNINPTVIFEIFKYFDSKLITGVVIGGLAFYLLMNSLSKILLKYTKTNSSYIDEVLQEIASQFVSIGSIIITICLMPILFGSIEKINVYGSSEGLKNWWVGLIFWGIGALGHY